MSFADIRAALDAAGAPPPHVLVAHSNSGLFAQQWAFEHPADVHGVVLVDPVTLDYGIRRIEELTGLLRPDALAGLRAETESLPPAILDPEQLDIPGTQRLLREEWRDDLDIAAVVHTSGRSDSARRTGYRHPDGRRVTVSCHRLSDTFRPKTLRTMIEDQAGWSAADLIRLRLLK